MPDPGFSSLPPEIFGEDWVGRFRLADGRVVYFRDVSPDDEPLILEAISTASRETLLHRFFSPIRRVSPELLRKMLAIDRSRETCIVGLVPEGDRVRLICGARYIRLPRQEAAEIALTVHDDFQRKGLGTFILNLIAQLARVEGLKWFEADVMCSNIGMLKLLRRSNTAGIHEVFRLGDVQHIIVRLESLTRP